MEYVAEQGTEALAQYLKKICSIFRGWTSPFKPDYFSRNKENRETSALSYYIFLGLLFFTNRISSHRFTQTTSNNTTAHSSEETISNELQTSENNIGNNVT